MPTLATGVDLIEISRLEGAIARHGTRLLKRLFTSAELSQVGDSPSSLAARFAAKEAVAKALGTGIGEVGWCEIEILHGPAREPILHLHGAAAQLASELSLTTWSISLSHSHTHAIAVAIALGKY